MSSLGVFIGYSLLGFVAVASEVCTNELEDRLLIADKDAIWQADSKGEDRRPLTNHSSALISLDYDILRNVVYWCDPQTREVLSLSESSSNIAIPRQKNWLPVGVAVEPLSGSIYVAEGFSDSVQMFDLKNKGDYFGPHVVIGTNVSELKKILLDPYEGYLFVLDRYRIFRSDLDGENHRLIYAETGSMSDILSELPTIVVKILDFNVQRDAADTRIFKKLLSVADIALDMGNRRVYWVDTKLQRIESSDYEGKDVRTLFENKGANKIEEASGALTLIGEYIYWADHSSEKVIKIDVNNASNNQVIFKGIKAFALKGISCSSHRSLKNPCTENHAKCQHLCVRSSSITNSIDQKFRCSCKFGHELAKDGSSCLPAQEFILYTQNDYVRGRLITSNNSSSSSSSSSSGLVDAFNPTKFEVGSKAVLDYDAEANLLYYTSLYPRNKLHQLQLDSGAETFLQPDLLSRDVGQFAYDWTTRNLYYFAYYYADDTVLSLTNARKPTYSKILLERVDGQIRGLVVHPRRGYLFFASFFYNDRNNQASQATITRLGMDGSNPVVIVRAGSLETLDGLAVDYGRDRIYWSQSQKLTNRSWKVTIRHCELDGSSVEELSFLPNNFGRPESLAVFGDSLYVNVNGQKLVRLDKNTGSQLDSLVNNETPGSLSGVRVFSRSFQADGYRPCASSDCDKLCLLRPDHESSSSKCACPYGEKLDVDGKSCVDNRDKEPNFLPCKFESFKCNRQTAFVK